MLIDTHAHLNDERLFSQLDSVLERARQAGVEAIVAVGVSASSSLAVVEIAEGYAGVLAAVGIQPNHCGEVEAGDWDRVVELASRGRVVAIGETGLDRYWQDVPFEIQQDYFDRHLRLAQRLDLPVIIHMRDCGPDVAAMVREARQRGPIRGVMHSFTGDSLLAGECLDLGLQISFAGMVTFKKSAELREVAQAIPADRILIETDSPYLSPHPFRGRQPNEPALLVHTAACLAECRGVSVEKFAAETTVNARRLFRLNAA